MNLPVYRKQRDNSEFYKILATDSMLVVLLKDRSMFVIVTEDLISIDAAHDQDNTIECTEEEFDAVYHKAQYKLTALHPLEFS